MANLTPSSNQLTEEQLEQLQSEDDYLRGTAALAIVNEAVKNTGVQIPASYVFKDRQNSSVNKAMHATFELLNGVPGIVAWALRDDKHLSQFYAMYAKMASPDIALTSSGNITIQATMPAVGMPQKVMDDRGFVTVVGEARASDFIGEEDDE